MFIKIYSIFLSKSLLQTSFYGSMRLLKTEISSGIFCKNWVFRGSRNVVMGVSWGHCLSKSDWLFFLRTDQITGRRDFFWKHFMERLRWKFPRSDLYEVTVPRNLMGFSFPGAHRIPGYADSCESISWKDDVIQRNTTL